MTTPIEAMSRRMEDTPRRLSKFAEAFESTMTPLIIGKTGQVARELRRLQPDAVFLDRRAADLTDPERCAAAVRAGGADAVINAAAYTAVDRAEAEEATALVVNARAPGAMARAAVAAGIPFLHISTDYVFDGHGHRPASLVRP